MEGKTKVKSRNCVFVEPEGQNQFKGIKCVCRVRMTWPCTGARSPPSESTLFCPFHVASSLAAARSNSATYLHPAVSAMMRFWSPALLKNLRLVPQVHNNIHDRVVRHSSVASGIITMIIIIIKIQHY